MKVSVLGLLKGSAAAAGSAAGAVAGAAAKGGLLAVGNAAVAVTSGALAASMLTYSSFVIYDTAYTQNQAKSASVELLSYRPTILESEDVPLSASSLSLVNDDYRAWLTIYNTAIDYPVMQGPNDLYYASHDVFKNASLTGAIYMASGNDGGFTDSYNLIYGHHMDQNIMFGALDRYLDEAYLNTHRTGALATDDAVYNLTAFAVVKTDAYEREFYSVGDRLGEVSAFLQNRCASTEVVHFNDGFLSGASRIVALSTCASATTNGRLVVLYAMTPRGDFISDTNYTNRERHSNSYSVEGGSEYYDADGNPINVDGSPIVTDADGSPVVTDADGSPVVTDTDGSPIVTDADGSPIVTDTDGSPVVTDTDGSPIVTDADGSPIVTDTDGSPIVTDADGSPIVADVDGGTIVPDTPAELWDGAEEELELLEIDDALTPLARLTRQFRPRGISYGGRAWALLNLICTILTAYLFLPLLHLRAKYGRGRTLKKFNLFKGDLHTATELDEEEIAQRLMINREAAEEKARDEGVDDVEEAVRAAEAEGFAEITEDDFSKAVENLYYHVKKFVRRFRLGVVFELLLSIFAIYVFIHTEDMRFPMILIDRWTPLHILVLMICWVTDLVLVRYRWKKAEPEKEEKEAAEREMAETAEAEIVPAS